MDDAQEAKKNVTGTELALQTAVFFTATQKPLRLERTVLTKLTSTSATRARLAEHFIWARGRAGAGPRVLLCCMRAEPISESADSPQPNR